MDEPTAALDPEIERHLVNALTEAARDRIVIAHRYPRSPIVWYVSTRAAWSRERTPS